MKQPKNSPNWNIAATHYLTSGFVMPFIFAIIGIVVIRSLNISSEIGAQIIWLIVIMFGLWCGVMYSASYIKKTYVVPDKDKIVYLSTIYSVVIGLIIISWQFF
ncbi:MAG TPA: hypothetical protein VE973_00960 [Candidatus Limnocylindria bacterium]|nr:hypothetical protein [Candidatus Limnocylindria bacterium]